MLVKQWSEFLPKGPYMEQLFNVSLFTIFPTVIFVIITITKSLARNVCI